MPADEPRIVLDPMILAGKPIVRGTRIAVELVIGLMAEGWSEAALLANYPHLTRDDVVACLADAHEALRSGRAFPTAA